MDVMGSTGASRKARSRAGSDGATLTLWDLAHAIGEETEKVFRDDGVVGEVSNLLLLHVIQNRVKNVYVEEDVRDPVFRYGRS